MIYTLSLSLMALVWLAIVVLNERAGLLSCDRFGSAAAKWFAYVWLLFFMLLLGFLVTSSAQNPARAADLAKAPFVSLFTLHAILVVFLAGWWVASGRPRLAEFLNFRTGDLTEHTLLGFAIGIGGWIFTIAAAITIAGLLRATGLLQQPPDMPPVVKWMAELALWKKAMIVFSAMTVEEFFFRSFLQKRIGLIASTALFATAHFTLGQPLLLIGVSVISLVIGTTFYRTKNVLPGIIAHGVFDAVQLFVIIPVAVKMIQ